MACQMDEGVIEKGDVYSWYIRIYWTICLYMPELLKIVNFQRIAVWGLHCSTHKQSRYCSLKHQKDRGNIGGHVSDYRRVATSKLSQDVNVTCYH